MLKYFPPLKNANIPNLITSFSVLIGFVCIILLINHHFHLALALYSITIILDRIDGAIARRLKLESDFGKELDSLADSFNFCLLPAVFAYFLGFNSWFAIAILFIYILAGFWRLANYNLVGLEINSEKAYFSGIPTTVAASWFFIVATVLLVVSSLNPYYFMTPFFIGVSVLMVSSVKYAKNGLLTKLLYILIPLALALSGGRFF